MSTPPTANNITVNAAVNANTTFALTPDMFVTKRNGKLEPVAFDKIHQRIKKICKECALHVNTAALAMKVIDQLYNNISTTKIDELTADQCASMASIHPDYNILAGRIIITNHHSNTSGTFSTVAKRLYSKGLVSKDYYDVVHRHRVVLDSLCDYSRDFLIDYFGFKTLERSYLMRIDGLIQERPQHMWLRVAIGIHGDNMERIVETYFYMSQKYFTHATPTLFNAGTPKPQLSSCYLLAMESDSLEGIYNTLKDCAMISKWAGGIGLHIHNVRATGSHIKGTNGKSTGIVPMLRVFNNTAKYVDQGSRRNGSFAIYLEPWHADIEIFLQMRKNHGDEELKARDLFYALWIPDLFMRRIKEGGKWTLMCPAECPGLADVYGAEFDTLYEKYEAEGRGRISLNARDLWFQVLDAQMETGTPYLLYKDAANRKSNQKNLGTIKSSNLCVAGDTLVLTDRGQIPIKALWVEDSVNVWNSTEFVPTKVMRTGKDKEIMEIKTSDGCVLHCTPEHKFFTRVLIYDTRGKARYETHKVAAQELAIDDELKTCHFPVIDGPNTVPDAYNLGRSTDMLRQYTELFTANLASKMKWFAGIVDAYYSTNFREKFTDELKGEPDIRVLKTITIQYNNFGYLNTIKMVLQTCGINPEITHYEKTSGGGYKYLLVICEADMLALCTSIYPLQNELLVCSVDIQRMRTAISYDINMKKDPVLITSITALPEVQDTFCFHEPKRNIGIFNGLLTSQCTEIIEYSDENESAVCNLASLALPAFIKTDAESGAKSFDYAKLIAVTRVATYNLNRVIDVNFYPTEKTRRSNMRHRPIGLGVQGLADVFIMLGMTFTSEEARETNRRIFETIYYAALTESCEIAKRDGPYETFAGSPASQGILQFDMWGVVPTVSGDTWGGYDWPALKAEIVTHGIRNSLLVAPMPTASTSQILGYNECIEPITSNIYSRRTIAGEFIVANKYLMRELIELGIWTEALKNNIVANNGSVQQIDAIPQAVRDKYRTVWELPMRALIDMAADRGAYICQSQSLNLWISDPTYSLLTSMYFYGWDKGLKTGVYYLRRRAAHKAQQFTVEPEQKSNSNETDEHEICESCSA